jgi:hypothetical protein
LVQREQSSRQSMLPNFPTRLNRPGVAAGLM